MHQGNNELFFALLRYALGVSQSFDASPTADEWRYIYAQAKRQSLIALLFTAVNRLRDGQEPPMELAMQWATEAEDVRELNVLFNSEAQRLTRLFEAEGHHTVILKGQANARLYPDPLSRQPGDIDIFLDGGKERVADTLRKLGMYEGADACSHHYHLPHNEQGITVEVHFLPVAREDNDAKHGARIYAYLQEQFERGTILTPEGFRAPSIAYALVMQLSHLRRHAIMGGIGLRQLIDYYMLLTHSTEEERCLVSSQLKRFGMRQIAGALMWMFEQTLQLPADKMIARPERSRGQWLQKHIMQEGNFGWYKHREESDSILRQVWNGRKQAVKLMLIWPEFRGALMKPEMEFLSYLIGSIPRRIRTRTLFFSKKSKPTDK